MSTRKVKNAKDLTTNELIYFKGHAKATYMSDGTTVEDAINNIENIVLDDYATKEELSSKQDAITDLEVIRQGAAKGATALQSYTEQYKGTVTGVKVNGTTKNPSNGVVDIGNVITAHQTLKTINGQSIIGSGDITISGSGGSSSGSGAYSEVNHGTSDTTFTLTPNTFHVWDEVSSLDLDFGEETTGLANEFLFQFNSGSEPTTLILPDDIKWANNSVPSIEPNMIYQVSILKGMASVLEFDNTVVTIINFTIGTISYQAEQGMTWEYWCASKYNTNGFEIMNNEVWKDDRYFIRLNRIAVSYSDMIYADTNYELKDDW